MTYFADENCHFYSHQNSQYIAEASSVMYKTDNALLSITHRRSKKNLNLCEGF